MLGKSLRPYFRKVFEGNIVLRMVAKLHVPPNIFSFIAVILAFFGAYYLSKGEILLSFPFVFLAFGWDAIDGAYARAAGKSTAWGAYIEGIYDLYVEIIVFLGLVLWDYPFEASLAMMLSLILSYTKPRAAQIIPLKDVDWPGIGEKFDRRLILLVSLVVAYFYPETFQYALYFLSVVVFVGGIQRMYHAKKLINDSQDSM